MQQNSKQHADDKRWLCCGRLEKMSDYRWDRVCADRRDNFLNFLQQTLSDMLVALAYSQKWLWRREWPSFAIKPAMKMSSEDFNKSLSISKKQETKQKKSLY